jgi:methylphosphotriester-DNA--protein-cysteine methyltransferase
MAPQTAGAAHRLEHPCLYGQVKASRDSGIYQVPSGRFYSWTTANMICFDTSALALEAGFRPAER